MKQLYMQIQTKYLVQKKKRKRKRIRWFLMLLFWLIISTWLQSWRSLKKGDILICTLRKKPRIYKKKEYRWYLFFSGKKRNTLNPFLSLKKLLRNCNAKSLAKFWKFYWTKKNYRETFSSKQGIHKNPSNEIWKIPQTYTCKNPPNSNKLQKWENEIFMHSFQSWNFFPQPLIFFWKCLHFFQSNPVRSFKQCSFPLQNHQIWNNNKILFFSI